MSRQAGVRLTGGLISVALVIAAGAVPAVAQYYPPPRVYMPAPPPPPPPEPWLNAYDVDGIVRSLGLTPVGRVFGRGPVLFVRAVAQEGSEVRVTLDRYSGRVVQVVRMGYGEPHYPAGAPGRGPLYAPDDEDDFDGGDLPPPSAGPRVITRGGDITGSVPRDPYVARRATGPAADPLAGVPREFRSQQARPAPAQPRQRTAARPADPTPRAAPLPRPRPADAPAVARQESAPAASAPAAKPGAPAEKPKSEPQRAPNAVPDAQGFE